MEVNFVSFFVWQITSSNILTLFSLIFFFFFRVQSGDDNLRDHFAKCQANATYRSKSTQAELIEIIGNQIRDGVIKQCKYQGASSVEEKGYFSVIADELQDCSNKEQLSLSIRYITGEGGKLVLYCICILQLNKFSVWKL